MILKIFFPPRCTVCDEVIPIGRGLCEDCQQDFKESLQGEHCGDCNGENGICLCHVGVGIEKVLSVGEYTFEMVKTFEHIKNDISFAGTDEMARMMYEKLISCGETNFDYVAFVPMQPSKRYEKGFNHAEALAEKIAAWLDVPLARNAIIRTDSSVPQHMLKFDERQRNAKDSYLEGTQSVSGKVILVDDITTTGATLCSCAITLTKQGAQEIISITAARTL